MLFFKRSCLIPLIFSISPSIFADDFAKLDQATPSNIDILSIAPVFDFDSDGCYPSAGISRNGDMNGGLKPSGSISGSCSSTNFMETSNTVHRYACQVSDANYCGHIYALYFEKDQIFDGIQSGHRHDWEWVAIWTTNGTVTHGTYSYHSEAVTLAESQIPKDNAGRLKFVYHKDGVSTHAMREAKANELAENPYHAFVTPDIVSWYELTGDPWNNLVMRTRLNNFDYGDANLPTSDGNFLNKLNAFKPGNYPTFSTADAAASNPNQAADFVQYVNDASGLCLDIASGNMSNGTNVLQWHCNGEKWQQWYYEPASQLIRSEQDPRFCLDNTGTFVNGANIQIWTCHGNNSQQFVFNGDGSIGMAQDSNQVLDGFGLEEGANAGTWWNWQGINQKWTLKP